MGIHELENKISELRELRRLAEEVAAEIAATEDSLKAYMTENGTDEIYGKTFKISYKEITSFRLDGKALKAAAPTIWEQFAKQTTTRRFVLA